MKRESKIFIVFLTIILITQLVLLKRISDLEVAISGLTSFHMKTNDILTGRICRILEHFDLPTEIVIDNPDGTTPAID
ncbi:hypothetical protein D1646_03235 [Pseudoflavonifractor sp. 60]|uniref:hypothetical protein n=1 Tax=Pseudoflavonifractor sp. 60 TaxID=2304576 RepID=UPI00136DA217|nr:hypothetical protein [Pseudoflavonifractor sp. 60]NBI65839.1 hypothetical protein [Pseudoflavonifractor sp. 60]